MWLQLAVVVIDILQILMDAHQWPTWRKLLIFVSIYPKTKHGPWKQARPQTGEVSFSKHPFMRILGCNQLSLGKKHLSPPSIWASPSGDTNSWWPYWCNGRGGALRVPPRTHLLPVGVKSWGFRFARDEIPSIVSVNICWKSAIFFKKHCFNSQIWSGNNY